MNQSITDPSADQMIPFVTVTNWVRAARLCSIDIEAIFRQEGIDTASLHPETSMLSRDTMQRLMQRCVDETRRIGSPKHFPVVLGETFAFEYMSDVETFITTSATLRDATRALEWIPSLINPYLTFALAEHGNEARIALNFSVPDESVERTWPFTEGVITTTIKFSRLLLGGQTLIGRITMRHPRHAFSDQVEAAFQVPVEWGAPMDALWFDRALLDQPLTGAFPILHEQAAKRLAQKVAQRAEHKPQEGAGHHGQALIKQIERAFHDKPRLMGLGLEALAEELGLHARTLQRRLKEVNESHSAIQGRVRYKLAQQWLRQDTTPIEDISDKLGFSDRRSFTQAFTRWSGVTPSQYRRQHG
ncbi:MAG: AraC family transcriptional regulator ligand-binding domain-containing protein [Aquabacterium sp.]|uniref:AraC family transcriptional regulator n=1 Tax=Aquabacterium sp. TaxID=1872578 RepID=UPI0025B833D6|nr:AraC family transcriptional regulator [Aquabacterium sp.]MBI5927492.1 AraC family transcriptional regulator ligand-binding domain-containing protein [Aquabacterium sp.]